MQEAHELAEKVVEAGHGHGHDAHGAPEDSAFRRNVGLLIGVLACLMAITSVGGSNMMKETINDNIEASDAYAFYQAKLLRQQIWLADSDTLEALRRSGTTLPPAANSFIDDRESLIRKNVARWESAPDTQDGKKELLAKAHDAVTRRDIARDRNQWFEIAEAMLQIAVVVASTSVLTLSRRLLAVCAAFGVIGVLASFNAFLGIFALPW